MATADEGRLKGGVGLPDRSGGAARKPEFKEIPSSRKEAGLAQFWHTSNIRRAL
jgi:hypothetical protein